MSEQYCKFILIVEDDQSIQETMIEMLQGEGYNPYSAINGKDALNLLRDEIMKDGILSPFRS